MNISIIIQARLGSTRLPGKVLKELLPGRSLLSLMLERIKRSKHASQVIVATSDLPADEAIAVEAHNAGCLSFRGSEQDVLGRYVAAAKHFDSDVVIRLCADSPLHDAAIVDKCIEQFLNHRHEVDYVSNLMPETFPYGTAVEVFPIDVLHRIDRLSTQPEMREHVTQFIHQHATLFKIMNVAHSQNFSQQRWAVDLPNDFELAQSVYRKLYQNNPNFSWLEAIATSDGQRLKQSIS